MRVIKIGKEWDKVSFEAQNIKCNICSSELEINSEDVKESVGENNAVTFYVNCPICFSKIKLDRKNSLKYKKAKDYKKVQDKIFKE